ncbi:MAG: glycosyltransferase [Oscillospiraceae bacterium]|nr:glycosyltransferase [Oscillospiraceae bacterium]
MKKILFVIPTLRMGGAEKALISLLNSLDPKQLEVDLFLFEQGGILQNQIPPWVNLLPEEPVIRAMTLEFRFYWKDLIRLRHFGAAAARLRVKLQGSVCDRLHGTPNFSWKTTSKYIRKQDTPYDVAISFLEGTTAFYVIDKVSARKKIGWIHTDFKQHLCSADELVYYRKFDELVTISDACKISLLNQISIEPSRVHVIANITVPEFVLSAAMYPLDQPWTAQRKHLLTVARLEQQKGIDLALEACKKLSQTRTDFQWHILGDGSMRQWLEREISAAQLEPWLKLEGVKSNPYPYMKAAFAIVQPSRTEGKSIVLDEAKILGKAILTTNYPSVSDQLINEQNGLIVDINANAIAFGVERMLDDAELVARLENNCSSVLSGEAQLKSLGAFYGIL